MTVDYDLLAGANTEERRDEIVDTAFMSGGYVSVTDALANRNKGGNIVLKYMDAESKQGMVDPATGYRELDQKRTFKLFCIRKEDGTPYAPGDVVEWEVSRGNRDHRGRKLTGQQINEMLIRGDRNRLYQRKGLTVDEKGCIECTYVDAATLLTKFRGPLQIRIVYLW
jgi:hypothetical protein